MSLGLIRQAAVPSLPSVDSPDFLSKLKGLLDVREGQTRNEAARFVTVADLEAIGITRLNIIKKEKVIGETQDKADTIPPAPPTNFSVVNDGLSHTISWTNPVDDDLYTIEVFRSLVQDRNEAKCIAVATAPSESVTLTGVLPTENYYYWIRAVDTSENYSTWVPNNEIGGWLVQTDLSLATTKILGMLNGSITENDFTALLRGKITKIGENTSAIEVHSAALNGISAQYYVKTDVNGYVSGFGLSSDTTSSSFVIVADRFAVVKPGAAQGAASVTPFVVGNVGGVSTVGINGNLIIDGTVISRNIAAEAITAEKIGANEINAVHIGANQIDGDHIAATSEIVLSEGGKLTVGNNNVILDSVHNKIIVAPDNGAVIGQADLNGVDYCELAQGNVNFQYWNGTAHVLYNSLKRVEVGTSIPNNVVTTIPGIWRRQPQIIVSPADIMTFNKNYVSANQTLVCSAENITMSNLSYRFTPKAYLRLTEGSQNTPINLNPTIYNNTMEGKTYLPEYTAWQTKYSPYLYAPHNTNSVTISGTIQGSCYGGWIGNQGLFYVNAYIEISGALYEIGTYSAKNKQLNTWAFSKTIEGLATAAHPYRIRLDFQHGHIEYYVNKAYYIMGAVNATNIVTRQGVFTSLADGTLNYMAIGE